MTGSLSETYTYRCGEKVVLEKNPNQFVVRALPKQLKDLGWSEVEQVSSASTRVTTTSRNLETRMAISRGVAPTHHAYQTKADYEPFLITDRIFVEFKRKPTTKTLDKFIAKYSLVLLKQYTPKNFLFQLTDYTNMNPVKLVVLLHEKESLIKTAGHDLNIRVVKYQALLPTDPDYINQWHLHNRLVNPEFDSRASSNCEQAWNVLGNYGDPEVAVAVTDDGCRLDHPDFDGPNKFKAWGYFNGQQLITNADFQANPNLMYESGNDHGTSCAGVIAGEADAVKTVGAAPGCSLLPIKWESDNFGGLFISDSKLLTALDFIADKVDVMSNSWGSSPRSNWETQVLNRIEQLSINGGKRGKGIIFLWAAGNENCPIQLTSDIPIPYTAGVDFQGNRLVWVGVRTSRFFEHNLTNIPGVMHIAALGSTAQRSHYSNYGPSINLIAPSSNQHTYFRAQVDGLGITTATGEGSQITDSFGGTSSATPLVAGIAALVISANPSLSATEVIALLKQTASKDLNFTPYPKTAPTDFDPDTSWDVSPIAPYDTGEFTDIGSPDGTWSPWFGHGKVDALAAITVALANGGNNNGDNDNGTTPPSSNTLELSATPNLSIPDNEEIGITDTISVEKTGILTSISILIDITHTYIGDLVVSLVAPSGIETILHNRSGASTNDLKTLFTNSSTAALNALDGISIQGDWQLVVKDRANLDVGQLNNWGLNLRFETATETLVELTDAAGTTIPDNTSEGIERIIQVDTTGTLKAIEIDLDLTHTYIGDLTVELIAPSKDVFVLHNQTGGSADNIIRTYSTENTAALTSLTGQSVQGDWTLRVVDNADRDIGKLNIWGLRFLVE